MSFNRLRAHKKLFWFAGAFVVSLLSASIALVTEGVSDLLARPPLEAFSNEIISLALKANDLRDKGTEFPAERFVIIEMDDASIERLGRINHWPRAFDAEVIRYISSGNPSLIIPDLLYTESDTLPSYYKDILTYRGIPDPGKIISGLSTDDILARAIEESGRVILSFYDDDINQYSSAPESELKFLPEIYTDRSSGRHLNKLLNPVLPQSSFLSKALSAGSISMFSGLDGVVRTYPLIQSLPESKITNKEKIKAAANISLLAAAYLLGKKPQDISFNGKELSVGSDVTVPVSSKAEMTLCFPGMEEGFRKISFYKVLENRMPAEFFENKVVFIGATASGVEDLKTTPVGEKIPGVYIHVAALFNLLNKQFISALTPGQIILINLIVGFLLALLFIKARPLTSVVVFFTSTAIMVFGFIFFIYPAMLVTVNISSHLLALFSALILSLILKYISEEREKLKLKKAFSSYVSAEIVNIISDNESELALQGEKRELTVLFSDIRNFTTYSEQSNPHEIISFLNTYLTSMTDVIFKFSGTVDKFMGDGIMVIFGAPVNHTDHATKACFTALSMISELDHINSGRMNEAPVKIGIGINTGIMTVGNIGSDKKFDYTVIGDSVNLGARLESLNKNLNTNIIVSEFTRKQVSEEFFLFRELGRVKVKGKAQDVLIHELMNYRKNENQYSEYLSEYNTALALYKARDFRAAIKKFEAAGQLRENDVISNKYLELCRECLINQDTYTETIYTA